MVILMILMSDLSLLLCKPGLLDLIRDLSLVLEHVRPAVFMSPERKILPTHGILGDQLLAIML